MRKKIVWAVAIFLVFIGSCVTVNIYFPAAAVQKAADVIVDEIQGKTLDQKPDPAQKPEAPKSPQGSLLYKNMQKLSFGPTAADAADVDINISTPAIRALKDSLKERLPQIKPFFEKAAVGHTNNGYLAVHDVSGLSLKEKADLARLMDQQNKDSRALYEEIVRANKLGADSVPKVEKAFANSWRDKAQSGWWIQNDAGAWVKK